MTKIYAICAALLLILALVASAGMYGHTRYEAGKAIGTAEVAKIKAQDKAQLDKQTAAAKAKEQQQAANTAAAERQMMQDHENADKNYQDTIAGLRAGTVRLRHEWTCPSLPATAARAGKPDADTVQREQDASALVRIAEDADAEIRALQTILSAERQ